MSSTGAGLKRSGIAILISFVVLVSPAAIRGQTTTLHGRVVDEASRPLAGVTVELVRAGLVTRTDESGKYSFTFALSLLEARASRHSASAADGRGPTHESHLVSRPAQAGVFDLNGRVVQAAGQSGRPSVLPALTIGKSVRPAYGAYVTA